MKYKGIQRRLSTVLFVLILAGSILLAGCGATESPGPTPPGATDGDVPVSPDATAESASPVPATATAEIPTTEPEPAGPTAETLAAGGQEVFAAECAECHGERGEGVIGPQLIDDGHNLAAYQTAEGLYNYVHLTMPQDAPGSLTDQQYLEVVAFLLLENQYVAAGDPLDPMQLPDIPLQ